MAPAASSPPPLHVAIIPDGNGRWAAARGRPRAAGYAAGAEAVGRVVDAAPGLGIGTLTFYAFSSDNWERPAPEVSAMLRVLQEFLRCQAEGGAGSGVRIRAIGRRDRLPPGLRAAIQSAEGVTSRGTRLRLRLAIDYSARDTILRAACRLYTATRISREDFSRLLESVSADAEPALEVDLLIRAGGEQRLSDFLLWESAYAELYFTPRLWPDFSAADLAAAVEEFHRRDRRFGQVPASVAS